MSSARTLGATMIVFVTSSCFLTWERDQVGVGGSGAGAASAGGSSTGGGGSEETGGGTAAGGATGGGGQGGSGGCLTCNEWVIGCQNASCLAPGDVVCPKSLPFAQALVTCLCNACGPPPGSGECTTCDTTTLPVAECPHLSPRGLF